MPANAPPASYKPSFVHFVGSIPLPNASTVFRRLGAALPNCLRRLPDGETASRHDFVHWQDRVFLPTPLIMADHLVRLNIKRPALQIGEQQEIRLAPTEYDEAAIASYKEFKALRTQGVIDPNTRFQVSVPTPVNVIAAFVLPEYAAQVEPMYEALLLQALRRIQTEIPAEDLAIQWDAAVEFAMLEGVGGMFTPWFSSVKEGIVERLLRLSTHIQEKVEMGFHLCYGDLNHRHFVEPKDMGYLVDVANALQSGVERSIDWVHMPVPKDRMDDGYFLPLKNLALKEETQVFLGIVQPYDLEGTLKRAEAARKFVQDFGIATECGLGRSTEEDLDSVIEIMAGIAVG
ncbi:MAG: hypothetical protein Q9201_003105 [Fulgogasparrea decipioides]